MAAALMPLVVFVVVRPDWYFKLNGLDSYFYSGYAQNLGDVIAISGDRHYFVSRWTLYLPNRLFFELFGADNGFLVLRWLSASLIVGSIAALGRRRWRTLDTAALCLFVLVSPMLLRTVMTDYADSVTVPLGILSIVLVSLRPELKLTAAVAGGCAACIAVANPIAAAAILCLVPAWMFFVSTWRRRLLLASIAAIACGATVVVGWVIFRFRYGIDNVYSPTLNFLKTNASTQDPLKSPRLWWMGYRIWIYLPLIVITVWRYLVTVRKVKFDTPERIVLTTCAVQYGFQIWYQFSQHGTTLEIPYYWSIMVPALLLGVIVIVGKLAQPTHRLLLPGAVFILIGAICLFRKEIPEVYSSWIDAVVVVAATGYVWQRFGSRAQAFCVCSMIFVVFTFQAGAPRPEPILPTESRVEASYETAFDADDSEGIEGFHVGTWFSEQMNTLATPVEQSAFFWIGGAHGHQMAAMFSAHVSGRWLNPGWGAGSLGLSLSRDFKWAVETGIVNVIAMVGTADDLKTMAATLDALRPGYRVVLEGVAPDNVHTNIRVVEFDPPK